MTSEPLWKSHHTSRKAAGASRLPSRRDSRLKEADRLGTHAQDDVFIFITDPSAILSHTPSLAGQYNHSLRKKS